MVKDVIEINIGSGGGGATTRRCKCYSLLVIQLYFTPTVPWIPDLKQKSTVTNPAAANFSGRCVRACFSLLQEEGKLSFLGGGYVFRSDQFAALSSCESWQLTVYKQFGPLWFSYVLSDPLLALVRRIDTYIGGVDLHVCFDRTCRIRYTLAVTP